MSQDEEAEGKSFPCGRDSTQTSPVHSPSRQVRHTVTTPRGKTSPHSNSPRKPPASSDKHSSNHSPAHVPPGGQYHLVSNQGDASPISTILLESCDSSPVHKPMDPWAGAGYKHEGPCVSYNCSCSVARNKRAKALEEKGTHNWDRSRRNAWEVHQENLLTTAYGGPPIIPIWPPPRSGIYSLSFFGNSFSKKLTDKQD